MCVNSIRPVNTVPVKSLGSAPAEKAGEGFFATKVCIFHSLFAPKAKKKAKQVDGVKC